MAKSTPSKKVVVTQSKTTPKSQEQVIVPKAKAKIRRPTSNENVVMPFGIKNYQLIIAGAALILLGMLLMSGGSMPSPEVWDESKIYSFRRITLAPIVILAGLVVEIFAIFRN